MKVACFCLMKLVVLLELDLIDELPMMCDSETDGHDGDGQEGFPKKNLCIASVGFLKDLEKGKLARI
ncbi:hypothetical protein QL285_026621 [Trifolium repens]|nr:hypothetical protein QL285_026621 [Trifolium repens]